MATTSCGGVSPQGREALQVGEQDADLRELAAEVRARGIVQERLRDIGREVLPEEPIDSSMQVGHLVALGERVALRLFEEASPNARPGNGGHEEHCLECANTADVEQRGNGGKGQDRHGAQARRNPPRRANQRDPERRVRH
jgi:hypothetical protein